MSETVQHVSDNSFEADVLQADKPVLVDFTATWCGPCKMMAPILDQVADEYTDKVRIVKVDVDDSQATAAKFAIRGVPTLMLFKDGKPTETRVGAMSKQQLTQFLDGAI